ncbi:MAG: hypothetical protein IGS48_00385 [Oscillatoriales cyanobacterium C42_A2020_001]|nr:hypothetical protein [Leptolyngbyaceae cyanobacterium C42_A2020_001]
MSEAVNPNMTPDPSLSDDANPADTSSEPEGAQSPSQEEWQTVDFPGAISVDTIPLEPVPIVVNSESVANPSPSTADSTSLVEQLQHENAVLKTQVAQLEEDLSQVQIELQLEVARFYCKEEEAEAASASDRASEDLVAAQEKLTQLTQDLTQTQQAVQQKQATIDILTQQLETSQQRIAQLERDCALSQQRYNEQLQLVSQAENTCRDLRMRLHRQQQQTLQFKAALEKSIELHSTVEPNQSEPVAVEDVSPSSGVGTASFIPKAQPVRPWSTPSGSSTPQLYSISRQTSSGLPNLLSKLAKQEPTIAPAHMPDPRSPEPTNSATTTPHPETAEATQPQPPAPAEPHSNVLEGLFPIPASPASTPAQPPHEAVFDLSPFIEAGEVDSALLAAANDSTTDNVLHPIKVDAETDTPAAGDTLWADLARLIEPELLEEPEAVLDLETEAIAPEPSPTAPATPLHEIPAQRLREPDISAFAAAKSLPPLSFSISNQETSNSIAEEPIVIPHNPFPSFTLRPLEASGDMGEESRGEMHLANSLESASLPATEPDSPMPPNWPSPILYPFRQPKKLKSMAAVDLPSFPRG